MKVRFFLENIKPTDKFDRKITKENLFGFLITNKKIVPVCNKVECSEKAIQHEKRGT